MQFLPLLILAAGAAAFAQAAELEIILMPSTPAQSHAILWSADQEIHRFPVGFGKRGVLAAGKVFRPDHSLCGEFTISAILSRKRFEMTSGLLKQAAKPEPYLRKHLFANMSQIDFDGDGRGGEYGIAYLALTPRSSKPDQPFHFGTYQGTYRLYHYALHGTQDETRIGQMETGGCLNARADDLRIILSHLSVGARVMVRSQ